MGKYHLLLLIFLPVYFVLDNTGRELMQQILVNISGYYNWQPQGDVSNLVYLCYRICLLLLSLLLFYDFFIVLSLLHVFSFFGNVDGALNSIGYIPGYLFFYLYYDKRLANKFSFNVYLKKLSFTI